MVHEDACNLLLVELVFIIGCFLNESYRVEYGIFEISSGMYQHYVEKSYLNKKDVPFVFENLKVFCLYLFWCLFPRTASRIFV